MKIAHIVPTENLQQVEHYGYHMALAPRLEQDPVYREWFRRQHSLGKFLIVDNGVMEPELGEALDFREVVDLANYVGADEVCLPDVPYRGEETYDSTKEAQHLVEPCRRLLIPQGEDYTRYLICAVRLLLLDPVCLGLNRAPLKFGYTRSDVLKYLDKHGWRWRVPFHAMGLWENPEREVVELRGKVRGLDTGAAAACAQQGEGLKKREGHIGLDHRLGVVAWGTLQQNLETLDGWANTTEESGGGLSELHPEG